MRSLFIPTKAGAVGIAIVNASISVAMPAKRVIPMAYCDWPKWAKNIEMDRQPQDVGIGDTIVHVIGESWSDKFQKFFEENIGANCGCTERRRWLNMRFPYPKQVLTEGGPG